MYVSQSNGYTPLDPDALIRQNVHNILDINNSFLCNTRYLDKIIVNVNLAVQKTKFNFYSLLKKVAAQLCMYHQ